MAPKATASGPPQRSRKWSLKNRRNTPDGIADDPIARAATPIFFGDIPVTPALLNFARDRKTSTEAVSMNHKFTAPALQAASASRSSLQTVDPPRSRKLSSNWRNGWPSRSQRTPPSENGTETPKRKISFLRARKPSKSKINSPAALIATPKEPSPSLAVPAKAPKKNDPNLLNSRQDEGSSPFVRTASPALVESTLMKSSIVNFIRNRTRSAAKGSNPSNGPPIAPPVSSAPIDNSLPSRDGSWKSQAPLQVLARRKNSFGSRSKARETSSTPSPTSLNLFAHYNPQKIAADESAASVDARNLRIQRVKRRESFDLGTQSVETTEPSMPRPAACILDSNAPQAQPKQSRNFKSATVGINQALGVPVPPPFNVSDSRSPPKMEIWGPKRRVPGSPSKSNPSAETFPALGAFTPPDMAAENVKNSLVQPQLKMASATSGSPSLKGIVSTRKEPKISEIPRVVQPKTALAVSRSSILGPLEPGFPRSPKKKDGSQCICHRCVLNPPVKPDGSSPVRDVPGQNATGAKSRGTRAANLDSVLRAHRTSHKSSTIPFPTDASEPENIDDGVLELGADSKYTIVFT
ncbi:hypothetical protein C8R46DRAFT_948045, partial [Mycena filopes]